MKYFLILLTLFSFLSAQQERSSRYNAPRSGSERPRQHSPEIRELNRQLEKRGLRVVDMGDNRKTIMPIENRKPLSNGQVITGSDAAWELNIEGESARQVTLSTIPVEDSTGNVYMVSNYMDPSQGSNFVIIKYDSLGNKLWENIYNGPVNGDDRCQYACILADRSLLLVARMQDTDFYLKWIILNFSETGILEKETVLEKENVFDSPEICFGPDGYLYMADSGISESQNHGWFIHKYNTGGNLEANRFFEIGNDYKTNFPPYIKFNHDDQLVCYLTDYNALNHLYLINKDLSPIWQIMLKESDNHRTLSIDGNNNVYLLLVSCHTCNVVI